MSKLDELIKKAREAGSRARVEKMPRIPPMGDYPTKQVKEAWLDGYDQPIEPAPEIRVPQVNVRVPQVAVATRGGMYLGDNEPLPKVFIVPRPSACIKCRCVRLAGGAQAVINRAYNRDRTQIYLECRACGHQFDLPVLASKTQ